MKLDRNINANGRGKYALLKLRKLADTAYCDDPFQEIDPEVAEAIQTLEKAGILDWGNTVDSEFFLIRLKDRHAAAALHAYAGDAYHHDREYAIEVEEMANRSGQHHRSCKAPD